MKRYTMILVAALLALSLLLPAVAQELAGCKVAVDPAATVSGGTVTVPVRIGENSGFTNLALTLEYDREKLTLVSILPAQDRQFLFGANTEWTDPEGKALGFVTCASAAAVKEDGVLFELTFQVAADAVGTLEVTPLVRYARNNEAAFAVFEELRAETVPGVITVFLPGDVNGDGTVEYDDVMLAYRAYLGEAELTAAQLAVADRDGSGAVEEPEYQQIYQIYLGG